ncbi:MAG: glutamyl-tRNA reductase [Desulfobacterales bacterium]
MRDIVLLGLNHKTASVEVRECLGFSEEAAEAALDRLKGMDGIQEAVLVSTCNRVELLAAVNDAQSAIGDLIHFLAHFKGVPAETFRDKLYILRNDDAVRHVFRVAASLDSMVVGEPQILGQIKDAYRKATVRKTTGAILNRLFHKTFFVAKRIRTETGIGGHAVSISYAAIELARKIFGDLEGRAALLIGAGEMAELAVEHLVRQQVADIVVANRTFERGVELANRFNGRAIRMDEIDGVLRSVDIIISSTGSPDYVLRRDQVKRILKSRRNRPLFFIDIAVPRDIDPLINRLDNTYVYDIDDLKGVIEENIEDRQRAAMQGERLVDEAVFHFLQWYGSLDVVPTIVSLRQKFEAIIQAEAERTLNNLGLRDSEESRRSMERMTQALVNKILHEPTVFLKREGCHGGKAEYLDAARKLFGLDD